MDDHAKVTVKRISVAEITYDDDGQAFYHGDVRFCITIPYIDDPMWIDVPFSSSESLDGALAASLFVLTTVGKQISEDARRLSASIGYDLSNAHQDEP